VRQKSLVERIPLALFSAVLMGGAVAFFFFAMPMVLLEQGVIASGLPTLIASAGPPLGTTARTLVAASFALASGGLTWLVITAIGFISLPRVRRSREPDESEPTEYENFEPRPEARRPIFAASELAMPPADEPAPVVEWAEIEEFPIDDVLELVQPLAEETPEPAPVETEQLPIAVLMARLEAGAERRAAKAAPVAPAAAHAAKPTTEFDGALRDALEELQRMAAR
jgi:hypothetical protein